ncbi:anthranilate phosphoribosyltransferase [Pseudomaricurvus alkylphenolicus]|uniref:anthranilate phosphoribosyltransferase n=1 Tax=Pseudomaricurvus alkylphenolicus TaxID=1306991 RepID=UPI00141F5B73|nr:anthranilate phosphoribosyltransferase [Pseudomaricurvus alkylphenolicus]NIB40534.1 anthranilate phosphoribosyltransferase [Pseudomaricurvus alkylphenolicus]
MNSREALDKVSSGVGLSREEMKAAMSAIMSGQWTDTQIAGLLIGLRTKGESVDEITAAAEVMREFSEPVNVGVTPLVDVVGTGGDGANLFNVSSASAFVVASSGARVAKHGNRGVSGVSGSADVLERLGINVNLPTPRLEQSIRELGIGFMFAQNYHTAMKNVIKARRELGVRTIFNILGPLSNPAGATRLLVGAFSRSLLKPMAEVLRRLGAEHVMVVHAEDGLDEISLATGTHAIELKDDRLIEHFLTPEQFGIQQQSLEGLIINSSADSAALIRDALGEQKGAYCKKAVDIISLNAGAAIYVSGNADSIEDGVGLARELIDSGKALEKMEALAQFCQS